MKCPVCEEKIEITVQKCPCCGFNDLRTEFINENELEMWQRYVVYPCRFAYQTSIAQSKELQRKFQKELNAIKKAHKELQKALIDSDGGVVDDDIPSFKKLVLNKKEGWVTKGNVTYKSFYKCNNKNYTSCEISNIVLDITGNRMTANFFVKKSFDTFGADSTYFIAFTWKLKDDYGIVVADGRWSNDKMQLHDITKGTISISGLDPSVKYVLELVNN